MVKSLHEFNFAKNALGVDSIVEGGSNFFNCNLLASNSVIGRYDHSVCAMPNWPDQLVARRYLELLARRLKGVVLFVGRPWHASRLLRVDWDE